MKFLILFLILKAIFVKAIKFPLDNIEQCRFGDTKCLENSMERTIKLYSNGNKNILLPPIDPFAIKSLFISQSKDNPVGIDLKMANINIIGLSKLSISKVIGFEKDIMKSKYEIYSTAPLLSITGDYKGSGRVLLLPINGEGSMNLTLGNVKIGVKIKPKMLTINNQVFWQVDKIKLSLEPQKAYYQFDGLFNGNTEVGNAMNVFLNENALEIWTELSESISAATGEIFKAVFNSVFTTLPYEPFFLPDS